jgi:hypothetical protein
MYALIENGEITRINITLPISIGNASIPKGATGLEAFGLYPIVGDEPKPKGVIYSEFTLDAEGNNVPVESSGSIVGDYDAVKQRIAGPQYVFNGAQVSRVFTVEAIPDDEIAGQVRAERNTKLTASDWTQVADAPVDKAAWATYRQALRDVTEQSGFPWTITWPTQPE